MRILYLINAPHDRLTGASRQTLALACHEASLGHEVVLAAPAESAVSRAASDAGLVTLDASFSASPAAVAALRRDVRAIRPDVVHAMSFIPMAMTALGDPNHMHSPACFVSVLVDPLSPHAFARSQMRGATQWLRTHTARTTAPLMDAVFCVSTSVATKLRDAGATGNLVVVHDAIDVDDLERRAAGPIEVPEGHPMIGAASVRLTAAKGMDVLLRAFAPLVERFPEARLLIAGEFDPTLDVRALAAELGVEDRISFLGFLDDTAPLFSAVDVFVLPSLSEGLNSTVLEAGALGVPVVATRAGGIPEAVADGETGLLVSPGDADALSRTLVALLGDTGTLERMGARARARVREVFAAPLIFATMDRYYEEAVAMRRPGGDA